MTVFNSIASLRAWRKGLPAGTSVGFVPTMGALHAGHAALLKRARSENEMTVLSIYVNPTQFNQAEDFEKYPQTFESDLQVAEACSVDAILAPKDKQELYPDGYRYRVSENKFSKNLCGAHRPGHFDGVLSVVLKLFQIVSPTRAYFGEKDYQQLELIRGMQEAFFLPVEVIACETLRESSGLALSSRNMRLSPPELTLAPKLYQILKSQASSEEAARQLTVLGFEVEYLVDQDTSSGKRRFVAAWLGKVRLIDNVKI